MCLHMTSHAMEIVMHKQSSEAESGWDMVGEKEWPSVAFGEMVKGDSGSDTRKANTVL